MGIIVIFWDLGLLFYHSVFHWESSQPFPDSLKTSHWLLRLHFGVVGLVCLCSSVSPACHTNEWTWQSESVAHFGDVCHWSCILAECWTLLRVLSALLCHSEHQLLSAHMLHMTLVPSLGCREISDCLFSGPVLSSLPHPSKSWLLPQIFFFFPMLQIAHIQHHQSSVHFSTLSMISWVFGPRFLSMPPHVRRERSVNTANRVNMAWSFCCLACFAIFLHVSAIFASKLT